MFIMRVSAASVRQAVSNAQEAHPELDQPFDARDGRDINEVIEAFALPQFAPIWQDPFRFPLFERLWIRRVFIHGDDARCARMRGSQRFREEAFGRFPIAPWTQEKLQGISDAESTAR